MPCSEGVALCGITAELTGHCGGEPGPEGVYLKSFKRCPHACISTCVFMRMHDISSGMNQLQPL